MDLFPTPPYVKKADISVTLDAVATTAFTWHLDTVIKLDSVPGAGVVVEITRTTKEDGREVDFASQAIITEANVDNMNKQWLYLIQELIDARVTEAAATVVQDASISDHETRITALEA